MTKKSLATVIASALIAPGLAFAANPGTVNFLANLNGGLVDYAVSPAPSIQQWFQNHFSGMIVYPPFFDTRLKWFPNGYAYFDLYAISPGSWEDANHPEWILHDSAGHKLYIPYGCSGGTCPLYAADIGNPAFRKAWITNMAGTVYGSHYAGVFVDDVNMDFQVSDGNGNPAVPIDSNTGQTMTWDAWRNYMATYLENLHGAVPDLKVIENSIWYAGPAGAQDTDAAIRRQIASADIICLERGVASDPGLQGGTGAFSVYSFFNFVDRVHAGGKGVTFQEYQLDAAGQQYGLASYFLISNGNDSIGDSSSTPDSWWQGYNVNLGSPLGPRSYRNGVFERDFSGGKVLLGEPGLASQTIDLGGSFTTIDGKTVTSVTLSSRQGYVLLSATQQVGVLNGASQMPGSISPGEVVSIPGSFSGQPQVTVNGVPATVVSVTSGQLSAIVPFGLDLSHAATLNVQGAATTVPVATASPAIFTLNATGGGPGAILNQDFSVNSSSNPATANTVVMVYATGLGALTSGIVDGAILNSALATTASVTAQVNGVNAPVLYAGAAPGLIAGVFQINVLIPSGVPPNAAAPITIQAGQYQSPSGVTIAIQ